MDEISFKTVDIRIDDRYVFVYLKFTKPLKIGEHNYSNIIFVNNKDGLMELYYNRKIKNYWSDTVADILRSNLIDNVDLLVLFKCSVISNKDGDGDNALRICDIKDEEIRNKLIQEVRFAIVEHQILE